MHKAEIDRKADKRWTTANKAARSASSTAVQRHFRNQRAWLTQTIRDKADKDRHYVQSAPYKGRVAADKIAEDNINLGAVHLADTGDHKSAMGHDFSTTHPSRTMTRVSRTKWIMLIIRNASRHGAGMTIHKATTSPPSRHTGR